LAEASALAFLSQPDGTYEQVARRFEASAATLWRWISWIGGLLSVPEVLAAAECMSGSGLSAGLIPREVPAARSKARSPERRATLLQALQTLAALAVWLRAHPLPPLDPSPLRCWLAERFHVFREVRCLLGCHFSPPVEGRARGPPRL
jgi:transposase-like protein